MHIVVLLRKIYILQLLPQNNVLKLNTITANDTIDFINSYIENFHCDNICIDISFLNVLDACFVSTICATKHYIKYPNGKINWKTSSNLVKELNENLQLGNCEYSVCY